MNETRYFRSDKEEMDFQDASRMYPLVERHLPLRAPIEARFALEKERKISRLFTLSVLLYDS